MAPRPTAPQLATWSPGRVFLLRSMSHPPPQPLIRPLQSAAQRGSRIGLPEARQERTTPALTTPVTPCGCRGRVTSSVNDRQALDGWQQQRPLRLSASCPPALGTPPVRLPMRLGRTKEQALQKGGRQLRRLRKRSKVPRLQGLNRVPGEPAGPSFPECLGRGRRAFLERGPLEHPGLWALSNRAPLPAPESHRLASPQAGRVGAPGLGVGAHGRRTQAAR